ncbi:hypothetical protein HHK36_026561 [Tetracentron sinense]|uniref:Glutaredoxin domain-containing protein n=1 Tax=Tetracentron sinense TaxID=13715 RepID=A0A834YF95_TETSI|nr:hypothetical protein HHK36_026561 [Tetracentron sinense]
MDSVTILGSQKAVVIFSKSSCCMCHTVKSLFYNLGVSPAIYELDEEPRGREMERALQSLGCDPSVPAVFIGGRLVNSTKTVMSLHLCGSIVPMLREAGAIWLYSSVVIFSSEDLVACDIYTIKILGCLGLNQMVHQLDEDVIGTEMEMGCNPAVPTPCCSSCVCSLVMS